MYSSIKTSRDGDIHGDQINVEWAEKLHDYAVSAHHVKFVPPSFLEFEARLKIHNCMLHGMHCSPG